MDQYKAKVLFDNGAILLFLDFPCGSEFGIDYMSWTVGANFRGVKMIPEGIHFVYYRAVNSDGQAGPRSGFFYNFSLKEVVVKKWDRKLEDISTESIREAELQKFQDKKMELDRFLGPYPYDRYKEWVSLTNHIQNDTLDLLQPKCGFIYSVAQFESETSTSQSRKADQKRKSENTADLQPGTKTDVDLLPDLKRVEGTNISYSQIPQKYPDNATPAEISKHNMDSSYALDMLLERVFHNDSHKILGEIQFAFVCFLIGQHYDSFEQWKILVHLLCTSASAILKYPSTFIDFISVIHFQIHEIPSDFFVDIVTSHNFLTLTLHELFENIIDGDEVNPKLKKRAINFRKHLTDKFNWDFTTEPDDYAPVVVDISA